MKFESSLTKFRQKYIKILIKLIPTQSRQRNKIDQICSFGFYFLEYFLLLKIINLPHQHNLTFSAPYYVYLILNILRAMCNIGFIITRNKIFLCFQKICLITQSFLERIPDQINFIPFIIFDLLCALTWGLSIQQEDLHFDSRLFVSKAIFKQLYLNTIFVIWLSIRNYFEFNLSLQASICLLILFMDKYDNLYSKKFKKLIISLDFCCLISTILPLSYFLTDLYLSIQQQILSIVTNIVFSCVYVYFSSNNFSQLFKIDPWTRQFQKQNVLDYFISLKFLIKSHEKSIMTEYMINHVRQCKEYNCLLKYHHKNGNKDLEFGIQKVINLFFQQQVPKISRKHKILQQYLIFNFSQKSQEKLCSSKQKSFFHRRCLQQFKKRHQKNNINIQNQAQFVLQIDIIPQLKIYSNVMLQFWKQLLQLNINGQKLMRLGKNQLKLLDKIENIRNNDIKLTQKSQTIINSCLQYLLGLDIEILARSKEVKNVQYNLSGHIEAPPTILVSAQKQDLFSLINVNPSVIKLTGYFKNQLLSKKIYQFWPKQIRQQYIFMMQKKANYSNFSSTENVHNTIFIKNKFGYALVFNVVIYHINDFRAKKWCLVMQPYMIESCLIILNTKRQVIGISQNSLKHGINLSFQGQYLNELLFNDCIFHKKNIKIKNIFIFQRNNFELKQNKNQIYVIKCQNIIEFQGKVYYYIFTVSKRKGYHQMQQTLQLSSIGIPSTAFGKNSRDSNFFDRQQQVNEVPDFTFSFNFQRMTYIGKYYNQEDIISFSQISSLNLKRQKSQIQYSNLGQNIIMMRLYENQLDFIQNLQPLIPNFQSLPNYELQIKFDEEKAREQSQIRSKAIPRNIYLLRIFFVTFLSVIIILLVCILIIGIKNKQKFIFKIDSQSYIYRQYEQLLTLGTILLEKNYNSSANISKIMQEEIILIDQTYKQMQNKMPTLNSQIALSKIQNYTLIKADDVYRLLIKGSLSQAGFEVNQVMNHIIRYISPGWSNVAQLYFNQCVSQNSIIMFGYIIFILMTLLLFTILVILFFKLKLEIQSSAKQICNVFMNIDHRVIIAYTTKLKSFLNYIDFDQSLVDQQALQSIRLQQNGQNLYKKHIVNQNKYIFQSFLFMSSIILLALYFTLNGLQLYKRQSVYNHHMQTLYFSSSIPQKIRMLWVGLNNFPRNQQILQKTCQQIINDERQFQIDLFLKQHSQLMSEDFHEFINDYFYGDVCQFINQECNKQLNKISKNSNKQMITKFFIKYYHSLSQNSQNIQQFKALPESLQVFKYHELYFKRIGRSIAKKIKQQLQLIIRNSEINNYIIIIALIGGIVIGIFSFLSVKSRIYEIIEMEAILNCIPFQVLKNNSKYVKFIEHNKPILR